MTKYVIGIVPNDEQWKKMKDVFDACVIANVKIPDKVYEFFDGGEPDEKGLEVVISYNKWDNDGKDGIEVEVDKIPKNVKIIRFVCSY